MSPGLSLWTALRTARAARAATAVLLQAVALWLLLAAVCPLARALSNDIQQASADRSVRPGDGRLPAGVRRLADLPYGPHARQRLDVYLPAAAQAPGVRAPVIFLVHGGAWRLGDKASARLVAQKVARWVPQGVVVVSANYRLLPEFPVAEQLQDVARALAAAQHWAPGWGADPDRFAIMGHSAGAHLAVLLAASPAVAQAHGVRPVRATVALDSAALDVPQIMLAPHLGLYDAAFGADPAMWAALSPVHQWKQSSAPILAVCSTRRDVACTQAQGLAAQGRAVGSRVQVLPQDLSHGQINAALGSPGAYTEAVEHFLRAPDVGVLP